MMISCREAARLSSEALERPLYFAERVALRFHLLVCLACSRYDDQIAFLQELVTLHLSRCDESGPLAEACLSPDARDRIRAALGC
ncbi:MAG: anti-sigma factor family protein [Planctomycetota bacterium]|jgi:hypothetical protein